MDKTVNSHTISRKNFIQHTAFGLGALSLSPYFHAHAAAGDINNRPNIIFILTDDQRRDALRCAGNLIIHTPNMDRLAENGVRFEYAFVTTPICTASRASIFTGLYERKHRFTFGTSPLARSFTDISYPRLMRQAGYRSGFIGKFGINVEEDAINEMFDLYENQLRTPYFKEINGRERHLTEIIGEKAITFLRSCAPGKPFTLSVSFNAPHAEDNDPRQYIWPHACDDLYKDVHIPVPKTADPALFEAQPEFLKTSMNRIRWKWRFDTPEKYQKMVKGYYRMISGVDMAIGRVMDELKKQDFDRNTIIIIMSDNGYFLGERGFAGKWLMYEDSIRVPLIVFDLRSIPSQRGIVLKQMVLNVDIAPTMLDLAGISVPVTMQGRSLVPLLNGEHVTWRTKVFCEHLYDRDEIPQSEGIRTGRWKYLRYRHHPDTEELYDLSVDPLEETNLAVDRHHRKQVMELRTLCNEMISKL